MAEFIDVWNAASRLCLSTDDCPNCRISEDCIFTGTNPDTDLRNAERIIMAGRQSIPPRPRTSPLRPHAAAPESPSWCSAMPARRRQQPPAGPARSAAA